MSHKHEQLLRTLFHDPVSGNIHWREIESLLHHLGAAVEPLSGARLRVKLNGQEGILHRPHHGNTLGRQDVVHLEVFRPSARHTGWLPLKVLAADPRPLAAAAVLVSAEQPRQDAHDRSNHSRKALVPL